MSDSKLKRTTNLLNNTSSETKKKMIDQDINNKKSIKYYVKEYLQEIAKDLVGKTAIDIPAGIGTTSEILLEHKAKVIPFDLFPEYFRLPQLTCERADVMEEIPLANAQGDYLVCQEGIEHFSDQVKVFKEFNRVLKKQGRLILTTPSYSNLASRFSYLIFESENNRFMPPNEIDSIWMSDKSISKEIYHGHIFLVGLQKLRILGKLAGFRIVENRYVRLSKGSLFLFPFLYPFILISAYLNYSRNMRKDKGLPRSEQGKIYREQLMLNISPKNLLNKHTFLIFEKEKEVDEVDFRNDTISKSFDKVM